MGKIQNKEEFIMKKNKIFSAILVSVLATTILRSQVMAENINFTTMPVDRITTIQSNMVINVPDKIYYDAMDVTNQPSMLYSNITIAGQWIQDSNGWWYKHNDGTYTKNNWEYINGYWYFFDTRGYMMTGWVQTASGWYYLQSDGHMVTGWNKINNKWYYMNDKGVMLTGIVNISGIYYNINSSGVVMYCSPTLNRAISRGFSTGHNGYDLLPVTGGVPGDTIRCFANGKVNRNDHSNSYGNVFYIQHSELESEMFKNGYQYMQTIYAHLHNPDRTNFKLGANVNVGDEIAKMGGNLASDGNFTGVHLHFETLGGNSLVGNGAKIGKAYDASSYFNVFPRNFVQDKIDYEATDYYEDYYGISTETGNIDLEVLLRWDLDDYKSEEVNAEMINQLIKQLKTNDFPQEQIEYLMNIAENLS